MTVPVTIKNVIQKRQVICRQREKNNGNTLTGLAVEWVLSEREIADRGNEEG